MPIPGYQAGYGASTVGSSASGSSAAPADAPYLVNSATDITDLDSEILIGALTSALTWEIQDAVTNATSDLHVFRHTTSGTPVAGFGLDISFELQDAAGSNISAAAFSCFYQDLTTNSLDSAISLYVLRNSTLIEVARFTGGAVANNEALMLGQNGGTITIASLDDPNTGIQWAGSDQINIVSGGANSITIDTNGAVKINNSAGAQIDFRVSGDTLTSLLMCDVSQDNIGIGTNPTAGIFLHLVEKARTSGSPAALVITGGAHTTLTASTEANDVLFNLDRTVQFSTGDNTGAQRSILIEAPTWTAVGPSAFTRGVTFEVNSAPVPGSNVTVRYLNAGRFGGDITIPSLGTLEYSCLAVPSHTATISGSTNMTAAYTFASLALGEITATSASAITVTNAATIYITNPPIAAGSLTITNTYGIFVDNGMCRFDGDGTHVFELPADATDPTGGGGAAAGRVPVKIAGATKYFAYY